MNKLFTAAIFLFFNTALWAQSNVVQTSTMSTATAPPRSLPLDKSPMDMAYFPDDYPVLKIKDKAKEPLIARVIYSRPQKAGRVVFGDMVEMGKVWRLGANEATEVEFFREVKIDNKRVPKGKYTLYAIAQPETWTMIFNKETDTWGSFKYDEKKDLLRVNIPVKKETEITEAFTLYFEKIASGAQMVIRWDDVSATLPIAFK